MSVTASPIFSSFCHCLHGERPSQAAKRGCGRLEWVCLDWNQPSINFYKSLGAVPMDEWTIYRIAGPRLKEFAEEE
ncbi:MAG: GNAT family N-acetyltransferase [Bacteroidales bacterium]|nr:GNAT family N-acetyltransferase [Bacteroidales bacterium]